MDLTAITTAVSDIRNYQQTATTAAAALTNELGKINDGSRSAEWIEQQTVATREKYTPAITTALKEVTDIARTLSAASALWEDKRLVLSRRALTPTDGNLYGPAKDITAESQARIALMMELAKTPTDMLHRIAERAKVDPKGGALLHLAALENNSRDTTAAGWGPISYDDVELPDRTQALQLLQEAKGATLALENTWKSAIYGKVNPVDRIIAARAGGAR